MLVGLMDITGVEATGVTLTTGVDVDIIGGVGVGGLKTSPVYKNAISDAALFRIIA